jgi:transcriptional regulator with XRE-family HTH domain
MDFGAKLKMYRERAGLSQRDLARESGFDAASINRFESGKRSPDERARLEDICNALGLRGADRDDLLWSAGYLPAIYDAVPPTDPTLGAVARVLADERLTPEDKEEFRAVLGSLARRWQGDTSRGGEA